MRNLDDLWEVFVVRSVCAGKPGAFDKLLDKYEARIFNLSLRMLGGNRQEAEDASQETFVAVYRGLSSFRGGASLDTWIHRIAVNVCLLRRRKWADDPAPHYDVGDTQTADPAADPLAAALRSELNVALSDAVSQLPEAQQTVVLLHGMQGFTYGEVAQILDCPVGTVKSRLSTAFASIRTALAGYMAAEPQVGPATFSTPAAEASK